MKAIKKYLLIAIGLLLLFILSTINQKNSKEGPCCPISVIQSDNHPDGARRWLQNGFYLSVFIIQHGVRLMRACA